ncbi:MAG: DUF6954 family protein [Eubacteriales bacterium]
MKTIGYIMIVVGFFLVSFFGLGPALLADGSMAERMMTLLVVVLLYAVLLFFLFKIRKSE